MRNVGWLVVVQGYTQRGIHCWSGNDDEAHDAVHHHGATGVISVTSNVVPRLFAEMMASRQDATNASLQVLFIVNSVFLRYINENL